MIVVAWSVRECAAGLSIVRFHDVPLCERMQFIGHPIVLVWCFKPTVAHQMVDVCPRSSASGDACRNMVILTNRRECLQVDGGLRTSAAHVSMSLEVLSGVVWVVRSRVPKIWMAAGVVYHQLVRSVSPRVSATCCLPLR